jgi:hypothetical protein
MRVGQGGKASCTYPEDLFLQVNNILKKVPQGYKWKEENEALPMRKFTRCADCGGPFTRYYRKNGRYYTSITTSATQNIASAIVATNLCTRSLAGLLSQYQLDSNLVPVIKKQFEIKLEISLILHPAVQSH